MSQPPLLERDAELAVLRERLESAYGGQGSVVFVEAAAGVGKTALLRRIRALAAEAGVAAVQAAVGAEIEQDFPFGVTRQLLEPAVLGATPERRAELLSGSAALAAAIVGAAPQPADAGEDVAFSLLHGLYWLVAAMSEERPLLLVVDDAHWADPPSLRFLDFLARRIDELALLVVVAARPDTAAAALLADGPHTTGLHPRTLSADAGRALVEAQLGEPAPDDVAAAAFDATGGNPLLLRELARTLSTRGSTPTAADVRDAVPSSVTRSVQRRLAALSDQEGRLVRALALAGNARETVSAAVAGLSAPEAVRALAGLQAAGLVEGSPPRFVHPLLRAAVTEAMSLGERAELHRRLADELRAQGEAGEDVVVHLLAAPPRGTRWAVERLQDSARRALAEGAPDMAAVRLQRALDELPPDAPATERERMQLELARAALRSGAPAAAARIEQLARSADLDIALPALTLLVVLSSVDHRGMQPAAERLERALGELRGSDPRRTDLLEILLSATSIDPSLVDIRNRTVAELRAGTAEPAVLVWEDAAGDAPVADTVALAERVLGRATLDEVATIERSSVFFAVIALSTLDAARLGDGALLAAEATVRRGASRLGGATTAYMRAEWALSFGSAATAEAAARESVELWTQMGLADRATGVRVSLARALARMGRLSEAATELDALGDLSRNGFTEPMRDHVRGELQLAQRRPAEAVASFRRVQAFADRFGWRRMPIGAPTAELARALIAAGEVGEGRALAEAEVRDARRRGARMLEAEALLALAPAIDRAGELEVLRAATEAAAHTPALYTRARAHAAFGAGLRRAGRQSAAREELGVARELAQRIQALRLFEDATEELLLAGGRPRRTALSGVEALTPGERRVAELAARGLKNREIAEALFVTRKTVESTLGKVFTKLDIRSRVQLEPFF